MRTSDLAREIAAYLDRPGNTLIALALLSDVNVRNLRAIMAGRYRTTSIWTADKVMTALGTHYLYLEQVKDGRSAAGGSRSRRRATGTSCIRTPRRLPHAPSPSPLRRAVQVTSAPGAGSRRRSSTSLGDLLARGYLQVGERLYASLVKDGKRRSFVAAVTATGEVQILDDGGDGSLQGRVFPSSSAAISALYGRPDGGWKNWWLERNGGRVRLEHVRDEHDDARGGKQLAA